MAASSAGGFGFFGIIGLSDTAKFRKFLRRILEVRKTGDPSRGGVCVGMCVVISRFKIIQ